MLCRSIDINIEGNARIGVEYGDLRVPVISDDPIKKMKMWRNYFPRVLLNPFEEYAKNKGKCYLGKIPDIFDKCIDVIENEYYLDIPKMATMEIFAPLFPSSWFVKKNKRGGLKETIKMEVHAKRTDIIKLFISKEDEKYAAELNKFLDVKDRIVPEVTITENFLKNTFSCSYSIVTNNDNKIEDKFIWDFSSFNFSHDVDSIDNAFRYYAHKNSTLYLFGADFIKFKERPADWSIINTENKQTLPVYLSKDKDKCKGLDKKFEKRNAGDFVWKNDDNEKPENDKKEKFEIESKEHLLNLFQLDTTIKIDLKNIYNSFCIPLFKEKDCTIISNNDRFLAFVEYGWNIIENTLLRRTDIAGGQIQKYPTDWTEIVRYILESTPKDTNKYCPTEFEKFIQQAAGQVYFIKEWNIKHAAGEYGSFDNDECQTINGYFKEIGNIITEVPIDDQEKFYRIEKEGGVKAKLKEINRLVKAFENIRTVFENRYNTILNLNYKAFHDEIDKELKNKDGKVVLCSIEDKKQLTPEQQFFNEAFNEERKKLIIDCVKEKFAGDIKWIRQLCDEPASVLWDLIKPYKPRSTKKLTKEAGPNSNLYRLYMDISKIKKNHTKFREIMRDIADTLELKGYWWE